MKSFGKSWITRLLILAESLILMGLLSGCFGLGGSGDWIYDKLPNGYQIWRVNCEDIKVLVVNGNDLNDNEIVLDRYILEFCYNNSYIGIKRLPLSKPALDEEVVDIKSMDTSNPEYYLIDAQNDTLYGPFDVDGYQDQINTLQVQGMCDWIPTVPTPAGAK